MKFFRWALLILIILAYLFPLLWMFQGSLMDIRGIMAMPPKISSELLTIDNYRILSRIADMGRYALNTAIVLAVTISLAILITAAASHAFAHIRFPWRKQLYWLLILGIMVPRQAMIIALFSTTRRLGINNSLLGIILPELIFPAGILLGRAFMESIPPTMIDAARVEGAGELRIALKITMPLAGALFAVIAVLKSVALLGDYLWQSLVLQSPEKYTLIVGLINSVYAHRIGGGEIFINPIGISLAAGTILFIPMFLVFLFAQRYFGEGLTPGRIKI